MAYNFDLVTKCELGTDVRVDTTACYGYFERKDGSEGGGLWFERNNGRLHLTDYDGMSILPKRVIKALRSLKIVVSRDFE